MLYAVIALVVGLAVGFPLGIRYRKNVSEKEISSAEEEGKRIVNEAIKSADYYDRSDAMVDYFDTAYYFDINIGDYSKPFEVKK